MAEENLTSEQREDKRPEPVGAAVKPPKAKAPRKPKKKKAKLTLVAKTFLTAVEILSAKDIDEAEINLPQWGGDVVVRGLSSEEHEKVVQDSMEGPIKDRKFSMIGYNARMAVACTYDGLAKDGGKKTFNDSHLALLRKKASGPVAAIAKKVQELSGLGEEEVEKMKEDLEHAQKDDSVSD